MNPLLGRLFENRSRSKTKPMRSQEHRRNQSFDKALVPKLPTKLKLQALPETQIDRRISTLARSNLGKLPTLHQNTLHEVKQNIRTRTNFRNRKLSTSIRDMQANIFTTELEDKTKYQEFNLPEVKNFEEQLKFKDEENKKSEQKQQQRLKGEEQLFQYLKVLQNNEQLNEQFCYMNRRALPYSFFIVDYDDRNRDEHLTVSLRGITYYKQEENEFYTIDKFAKEIEKYKQIKQIYFFQQYIKAKVMNHWKQIMLRRKFNLKCKYITSHLFSQNMLVQQYLHFLHNLAVDYSGGNFFNFNINLTLKLQDFIKMAENGKNQIIKSIKKFDLLVQKTLRSTLEKMLHRFRADQRVTIGSDKKQQDQTYLPFDSKRKSMKYTQMAKLKEFQWTMYRLIKYTDMLRFNVKLELIRKCFSNSIAELKNLKKSSESKQTVRFTNWIEMDLLLQGIAGSANLHLNPSIQQVQASIVSIKQSALTEIFKEHRLLIEKSDALFCQNIQLEDQEKQKPSRYDLKYFALKQPQFQSLQSEFQSCLKAIINKMENYMNQSIQILLKIYNKNAVIKDVTSYLSNHSLKNYLEVYRQDYNKVAQFQDPTQFALALVQAAEAKQQVRRLAEEKYKVIANAVPNQVIRRCSILDQHIRNTYSPIKQNPSNVKGYILFLRHVKQQKTMVQAVQNQLDEILQFQLLVYKYNIRIGQQAKMNITDVQTLMKQLAKRFEDIQQNQQKERKKFQLIVQGMIPLIQQRSQQLLKQIKQNQLVNTYSSEVKIVAKKIAEFIESYQKIKSKKQQLFDYQRQLSLGHRQLQIFQKMQIVLKSLQEVWKARAYYLQTLDKTFNQGYGSISELDIQPLNKFMLNLQSYSMHLQCFDLLNQFKQNTVSLLKVIKLSKLLASDTLMPQHIQQLKQMIKAQNGSSIKVQLLFSKDSKASISPQRLIKEANVLQIQDQISEVVYFSSQQSLAKTQLNQIQQFWRKTKVKLILEDLAQNQLPILHLDKNEDLQQAFGYFVITLKNLQSSPHVIGLAKQRTLINSKMCSYLRDLLWSWQKVEKQWINLLPVMANSPAVKHQSNVFFDFTSADSVIKKFIRQVSQMSSLKRLCDDYSDRRFMNMLQQMDKQLQNISKAFMHFLELKRTTYGRFCFISDQQLIQILQYAKDALSASKFVSYCFNAQKIQLDGLLMSGFEHKNQAFQMRKIPLKGQPDQIFKTIQENMKYSLKFIVKIMTPKLKITTNTESVFNECSTQTILVCDHIFWTEMSQNYLTTSSYEEYKLVLTKEEERVADYIKKAQKKCWLQTAIRLTQLMHFKEIGMELIRDQITVQDFKWKEQIRMYLAEEDIFLNHFDYKLSYSCQYRPPLQIIIPTNTSTRFLYQSFRACQFGLTMSISGNQDLQCKRQLVQQASCTVGTYSREVICSKRLSANFLLKIVQGVIAAGAWSTFYQFQSLTYSVCAQFLVALNKANVNQFKLNPYLFMIAYDVQNVQQISVYSFVNYTAIYPQKQKVCEWLFQLYKFQHYQELTERTLQFLKIVKPFLNKALSSEYGWIRQIVKKAGTVLNCKDDEEDERQEPSEANEFIIVAEALRDEVILKQEQTKLHCLSKALFACFGFNITKDVIAGHFQQKVQTLCNLLKGQSQNIIVLGERSCKTEVIKQSLRNLNVNPIWLFPNATQNFFNPQTIDYLGKNHQNSVIVYDGNDIIMEWSDLITSGFLLIEGKKAVLRSKRIMQLRSIDNYLPSFISQCQILYMGKNVVPKWSKLHKLIKQNQANYDSLKQVITDLFGKNLQNIDEQFLLTIAALIAKAKISIPVKNMQKIVVWFIALLGQDYFWKKYYGGQFINFMLNQSFEIVAAEPSHSLQNLYPGYKAYLLVPTKTTAMMLTTINHLLEANRKVHVVGNKQSGKTSLMHMISHSLILPSNVSCENWSQSFKKRFTYVRRGQNNLLIDFQKQGTVVVVDDLELGNASHQQYLRGVFQSLTFRDKYFQLYFLQKFQLIAFSRPCSQQNKYWSNTCKLRLPQMQKQSVQSIFAQNFTRMITDFSMNREVQEILNQKVVKAALIVIDDLCNLLTNNQAAALTLGLLRNLLSLPKKQAYISSENFIKFFKTHLHSKMHENSSNSKILWQINSIQQNILKVFFSEAQSKDFSLNLDGQYRVMNRSQLQEMIKKIYPNMVVFDRLLDGVVYICNQIRCVDKNVVVLGKRGTGKHFLIDLCSKLTNIAIAKSFSDALIAAFKYQKTILIDSCDDELTYFQQLVKCQNRKDLQRFIDNDKKQLFYSMVAESTEQKLIDRCHQHISFIFNCDDKEGYQALCRRFYAVHNMPVCLLEEWPASAILNMYTINDPNPNLHAQLFTKINAAMTQIKMPTFSLKMFQKYLKIYYELLQKGKKQIQSIIKINQDVYKKFNESFELVTAWQKRVGVLRVQIEDSITKSAQNIVANEVANMCLTIFLEQIKEQEKKSADQEEDLKILNRQIQLRIQFIKATLRKIEKIISSFQRTQMGQLKKVYKMSKITYFGVQCLCILLREQSSEEKTINKILADPNLLMRMKSNEILQSRNKQLQKKVKNQFEQLKIDLQNSDSQLSKSLVQWILSLIQYWQACEKQKGEKQRYGKAKSDLQQSIRKHEELKRQVKGIKQIIEQKISIVEFQLDQKEKNQKQLGSISQKLQTANNLIPILKKEQMQALDIINSFEKMQSNLRGNCILAAVTASFVPMQPLAVKQKLLTFVKGELTSYSVKFSENFISELTNKKMNSLQNLNLFLLEQSSLSKLVYDPQRKFLLYLQENSAIQMRQSVIENSEEKKQLEEAKIYHVTTQYKGILENTLIIDWTAIAIEEKQVIFLKLAQYKRPEYFEAKKELQVKITRNLAKVQKLKQDLYKTLCQKEMKIIEDDSVIQLQKELQKLQKQNQALRCRSQQKINEIKLLTQSINEEVTKLINIYDSLKNFKNMDIQLVLNICCREGDVVSNFIRWGLTNISQQNSLSFGISLLVAFNRNKNIHLLKDIIKKSPLRTYEGQKTKKPALISTKNWQIILKLTNYGGYFKKLPQQVTKSQKQFEQWCINQEYQLFPFSISNQTIDFLQHLLLLFHFKPRIYGYLAFKLIQQHLPYDFSRFSPKQIISMTNHKFPLLMRLSLQETKKLSAQMNEGKHCIIRVSKLTHENQMKRVVWKCMQNKQWLICYDIQCQKDLLMMEAIIYYVMNYDQQEGFRVFLAIDNFGQRNQRTQEEKLVKSSAFLTGICPQIYPQLSSCDKILSQNGNIEYLISLSGNHSSMVNKVVFNKMYKMIVICYTIIQRKYPNIKFFFKRMLETLQFIKIRQTPVEFNIFTIVNYLSKVMSHQIEDLEQRREIEEIWDLIVNQKKINSSHIFGIPLQEEKIDHYLKRNTQIMGCSQSYLVRLRNSQFDSGLKQLYKIFRLDAEVQANLAFLRTQLGKLPVLITGKQMLHKNYSYFYDKEVQIHNMILAKTKQLLQDLNDRTISQDYLEKKQTAQNDAILKFINQIQQVSKEVIQINNLQQSFTGFINKIKQQHQFLLYFNPSLSILKINPNLLTNIQLLIETHFIDFLQKQGIHDAHNYSIYLQLRQNTQAGIHLTSLKSKQFNYNQQMKTIGPNYEVDGMEALDSVALQFKRKKDNEAEEQEIDDLDIQISSANGKTLFWGVIQYRTVFVQWVRRGCKLIADST